MSSSLALCLAIIAYRVAQNVTSLEVSRALMLTAEVHRRDLNANPPVTPCTLHSWQSSPGYYTGCCYNMTAPDVWCMFDKPRELSASSYIGRGYEVASRGCYTVDCALYAWIDSPPHRKALLDPSFRAIGCSYSGKGKATVAWFGREHDVNQYANCLPQLPPIPHDTEPRPEPCRVPGPSPTPFPSSSPTTFAPSVQPTAQPSARPTTITPTFTPTVLPTQLPTKSPTITTDIPTSSPTAVTTTTAAHHTSAPTSRPTKTSAPTTPLPTSASSSTTSNVIPSTTRSPPPPSKQHGVTAEALALAIVMGVCLVLTVVGSSVLYHIRCGSKRYIHPVEENVYNSFFAHE